MGQPMVPPDAGNSDATAGLPGAVGSDAVRSGCRGSGSRGPKAGTQRDRRGFVLILVVGMLSVLVVLGLSFAEQGRIQLTGAGNSRDGEIVQAVAETGFQYALRALRDDRNVWSNENSAWKNEDGAGWTGRWGYNGYTDVNLPNGVRTPTQVLGLDKNGPAPNRLPRNMLDSWRMLFWNEESLGGDSAFGYGFKFEPTETSKTGQRHASDLANLQDTVQLQPLARVRKFKVQGGPTGYARIQVGITPLDGAPNLNDVFDPGTVTEGSGWYQTNVYPTSLPYFGNSGAPAPAAEHHLASPDRRTLEYILGRRPEYANVSYDHQDAWNNPGGQNRSNVLSGNEQIDDGVLNFHRFYEPWGRWDWGTFSMGRGWGMTKDVDTLIYYNSGLEKRNRYNFEPSRYVLWAPTMGMSLRRSYNQASAATVLVNPEVFQWFMPGRYYQYAGPIQSAGVGSNYGYPEVLFNGFGFDLKNPKRAGIGMGSWTDQFLSNAYYLGAGAYGHPRAHTFQYHFLPAVAKGRFWTDLMASWYFGGAPGYTSKLGHAWGVPYSNWTHLGSSYDSLGLGTHWMPPTMHVWNVGQWNNGQMSNEEVKRRMTGHPGNMPPAKVSATYPYPMRKWEDDALLMNAHFLFNNARVGLRAYGIQEPWGRYDVSPANASPGRWYDAIDINNTNFSVVYGLLTPEKLPSMLNRTVVAPHLHWKARLLDGAYSGQEKAAYTDDKVDAGDQGGMEQFGRYGKKGALAIDYGKYSDAIYPPWALKPYDPLSFLDANYLDPEDDLAPWAKTDDLATPFDETKLATKINEAIFTGPDEFKNLKKTRFGYLGSDGKTFYPYNPLADNGESGFVGPIPTHLSIHRHYEPHPLEDGATGTVGKNITGSDVLAGIFRMYNRMDFKTSDPLTGEPADDVFENCQYHRDLTDGTVAPKRQVARLTHPFNNTGLFAQRSEPMPVYKLLTRTLATEVFALPIKVEYGPKDNTRAGTLKSPDNVVYAEGYVPSLPNGDFSFPGGKKDPYADAIKDAIFEIDVTGDGIPDDGADSNGDGDTADPGEKFYVRNYHPFRPEAAKVDAASYFIGWRTRSTVGEGAQPHPLFGLPNPNYMLCQPGMIHNVKSYIWADQFRRYFPLVKDVSGFGYRAPHNRDQKDERLMDPTAKSLYKTFEDNYGINFPNDVKSCPLKNDGTRDEKHYIDYVYPDSPAPKGRRGLKDSNNDPEQPFVPAIGKDEGWRITRVGMKYQEIIANEIMDYQMNPWWPNPVIQYHNTNSEEGVPLTRNDRPFTSKTRSEFNITNELKNPPWQGFRKKTDEPNIEKRVPPYFAYWNRFWVRPNGYATRVNNMTAETGDLGDKNWGKDYEKTDNPVENRGMYPQAFQYWGQFKPHDGKKEWMDQIPDFPFNNLEDGLGAEFRYTAGSEELTREAKMRFAPARNHPFKNWADFVAFLGHLVYRSPMEAYLKLPAITSTSEVNDGSRTISINTKDENDRRFRRHPVYGVNAWAVCHDQENPNVDARNKNAFFDGSMVYDINMNPPRAMADSLQGVVPGLAGRLDWETAVVARDGWWPISGNYGEFPRLNGPEEVSSPYLANAATAYGDAKIREVLQPGLDQYMYPSPKPAGWGDAEWKRRIDELRGCDESGLRIEHQYISEAAANDILVSFSNGRVGPIDFNGNGWVEMTQRRDLHPSAGPTAANFYYVPQGYPWHNLTSVQVTANKHVVRVWKRPGIDYNTNTSDLSYGVKTFNDNYVKSGAANDLAKVDPREIILGCVTLPIKFRSNTFRVSVVVEQTDSRYEEVYRVQRNTRYYSRIPNWTEAAKGTIKVQGPYTGRFIQHGSRTVGGADPNLYWLGVP